MRGHAVAAALLDAGGEREGERVEEEVVGLQAVAVDGDVVDGPGGAQLPLRRAGLALLVDAGATTAAPYSLARDRKRSSRVPGASPSSRLTELRMALPPIRWSAVSTTVGSVESIMSGTVAWVAKRLATSSMSAVPSRPT